MNAVLKAQLNKDASNRRAVLANFRAELEQLDHENVYEVFVVPKDENRRNAQNNLLWCWNQECGRFYGESADYMHGENKRKILCYLMLEWPKHKPDAELFLEAVKSVPEPEHQNYLADKLLRTSTLGVKQFAAYLSEIQLQWAKRGLNLSSSSPEYDRAMGFSK